jgi:hypothetical protein
MRRHPAKVQAGDWQNNTQERGLAAAFERPLFVTGYASGATVVLRPKVHGVSPLTSIVHRTWCSLVGNHRNITTCNNPVKPDRILCLFRPENRKVTITSTKIVQFTGGCHPSPETLVVILQYCGSRRHEVLYISVTRSVRLSATWYVAAYIT